MLWVTLQAVAASERFTEVRQIEGSGNAAEEMSTAWWLVTLPWIIPWIESVKPSMSQMIKLRRGSTEASTATPRLLWADNNSSARSAVRSLPMIIIRVPIRTWYKSNQTILCILFWCNVRNFEILVKSDVWASALSNPHATIQCKLLAQKA